MADLRDDLLTKVTSFTGKWTSVTAFGSFFLYLTGYLALRFQLSTYGVATNLDVWDERYFFAGCRFLVYLVAAVPNVLLMTIVVWVVFFVLSRMLSAGVRSRITQGLEAWAGRPNTMPLLGMLLAVALIQFVMRQCFDLGNLLLRPALPEFGWINGILLTGDGYRSLYFSGLVGGVLLTGAVLLFALRTGAATTAVSKMLTGLLIFLVGVQFLLLPVNYGILIASQDLPRVAELPGDEKLASGERAWLVWESKEAMMYLRRSADDQRALVTVPRKETKTSIVGYDAIFRVLFGDAKAGR